MSFLNPDIKPLYLKENELRIKIVSDEEIFKEMMEFLKNRTENYVREFLKNSMPIDWLQNPHFKLEVEIWKLNRDSVYWQSEKKEEKES